jgi:hypothetical protein
MGVIKKPDLSDSINTFPEYDSSGEIPSFVSKNNGNII